MTNTQVVVITGASAGVGRAAALRFARGGARIGLIARGEKGLKGACSQVEAAGGQALALPLDVADAAAVEQAAEQVEKTFGPIDVWINSAMATVFAPLSCMLPEEIRRVTEVTYLGTVHGTMAAYRRMRRRNRGVILQVGSALAYQSIPLQSAYCAAKAAIRGFTDALRCELIHDRSSIQLTMVQLPAVNTPQFNWARARIAKNPRPVAPVFQPEPIAEAIWWVVHHGRREFYLGLSSFFTIWGAKLTPGLMERYLARSAVSGQQTDRATRRAVHDNLFKPVEEDYGIHGSFGDEAYEHSVQFELAKRSKAVWSAIAAAALAGGLWSGWKFFRRRKLANVSDGGGHPG